MGDKRKGAIFLSSIPNLVVAVKPRSTKPLFRELADGTKELIQEEELRVEFIRGRLAMDDLELDPDSEQRIEERIRKDALFGSKITEFTEADQAAVLSQQQLETRKKVLQDEIAVLDQQKQDLQQDLASKDGDGKEASDLTAKLLNEMVQKTDPAVLLASLAGKKYHELRTIAVALGLETTGKQPELLDRITGHLEGRIEPAGKEG